MDPEAGAAPICSLSLNVHVPCTKSCSEQEPESQSGPISGKNSHDNPGASSAGGSHHDRHQTTALGACVLPGATRQDRAVDAIIEIRTGRRKYRFAAEVKTVDRFETAAMVKAGLKNLRKRPLLVAPYITREICQ